MKSLKFLLLILIGAFALHIQSEAMPSLAESGEELQDQPSQNRPIATVIKFRPDVYIKKATDSDWREISVAQTLFSSDTLRTGNNGYAIVRYMDMSEFRMRPNSILVLDGEVRGKGNTLANLTMQTGEVFLEVIRGESDHSVTTTSTVAAVKGTSFSVKVDEDQTANYTGFSGEVEISRKDTDEVYELSGSSRIVIPPDVEIPPIIDVIAEDELDLALQSFDELERMTAPEILRVRVMDENGNVRTIRIPYFKNVEENE